MKKIGVILLLFMLVLGTTSQIVTATEEDITSNPMTFPLNRITITDWSHADYDNSSDTTATLQRNDYIECTVNTLTEKEYLLTLTCGTKGSTGMPTVDVSVNGTLVLDNAEMTDTGSWNIREPQDLGYITLKPGANVIKFQAIGGSLTATQFSLLVAKEDITSNPMKFALNTNTISDQSSISSGSNESQIVLQPNKYLDYTVNTKTKKEYLLTFTCGTNGNGYPLARMDVYVNDKLVLDDAELKDTRDWNKREDHDLGIITLKPGVNTIRFKAVNSGSVICSAFSLTKEDIATDPMTFALNINTILDTSTNSSGSNESQIVLQPGKYLDYTVNTTTEKKYKLTFTCGTNGNGYPLARMDVSINNELVLDDAELKDTGNWNKHEDHDLGFITLKPGANTIRFKAVNSGSVICSAFSLSVVEDYVYLENFSVVTKEGARLPYVVKDGFTAYAKVDVVKSGNVTGEYLLMLAQYAEDTSLVGISVEDIDVSQLANKEKTTFTAPLTYKGNGGWVKAFLVNKETMAPQESCLYVKDDLLFSEEVIENVLNEQTYYTDATNVKNLDGAYYTDYSIHDDNYDIDAIFYDSVVGEQSKVFAYIGVPKGASEANPVPAVVCVHGGDGVAFPEWVKKWNDEGYAAIAMTLTGDGPDAPRTPNEVAGKTGDYLHPYHGVTCWGTTAFLADVESAAMYQNVLNVIRAHNVLRSYPGVDETKTGITGISWGGVTTTTVIGVDDRFKFAVPVYGTGYLDESETYFSSFFGSSAPRNTVEWDPANFAARSSVPTLYINSDSDRHFSVNSTTKTAGVTTNSKISIHHMLPHGFSNGWGRPEIYAFADAIVKNDGTDPFITISEEKVENGVLTAKVAYPAGVSLASVTTYYITEEKLPYYTASSELSWTSVTTYTTTTDGISVSLPSDATFCYASLTDNNGNIISTKFIPVA